MLRAGEARMERKHDVADDDDDDGDDEGGKRTIERKETSPGFKKFQTNYHLARKLDIVISS